MLIYLVLILCIILLGAGIHPRKNRNRRRAFLVLSFLLMTIVSGFRDYSVGVDTASYVVIFNNIEHINFDLSRYETGFLYYVKFLHKISSNPTFFLLVTSAICIGIVCLFIGKYSEEPTQSVLLYIVLKSYFFQMTGIRQSLATAFVLLAFSIILEEKTTKKYILSAIMLAIAISLHTLAFVALIPYVIWIAPKQAIVNRITPNGTIKWSLFLSVSAFVLYPYIMRVVSLVFPQYARYFFGTWSDANYSAALFKLLIQVTFLVVGCMYIKQKDDLDNTDKLSLLMMTFSIVIGTLSMRMEIWGRLLGVFSVYTPLIWTPSFSSAVKDTKNRMILKSSIFAFSMAYMLVTFIFRPEWDGVVPYLFR